MIILQELYVNKLPSDKWSGLFRKILIPKESKDCEVVNFVSQNNSINHFKEIDLLIVGNSGLGFEAISANV